MIGIVEAFSSSYKQARVKFLEAAATAGLQFETINVEHGGHHTDVQALDLALQAVKKSAVVSNEKKAEKLLIINSSNTHGDQFAGMGVLVYLLHDEAWREKVQAAGLKVLYAHGYSKPLFESLRKHIDLAAEICWVDLVDSRKHKKEIHDYFVVNNLDYKCWISDVKTVSSIEPVWQGQTISLARQALFKAVDGLNKT